MSVGGREARWVTGGREAGNVLAVRGDVAGRGPRGVPVWYGTTSIGGSIP